MVAVANTAVSKHSSSAHSSPPSAVGACRRAVRARTISAGAARACRRIADRTGRRAPRPAGAEGSSIIQIMSILKVARMGHPVLRAKARLIEKADIKGPLIQKLIDDMLETMAEYHGVGLAAPQVHEDVRLFVAGLDAANDDEPAEPIALINPEIAVIGGEVVEDWEGCLSIPEIRGRVPRAR